MTLRLTDEETEALRRAALAEGVSMQEFARRAIRDKASSWHAERDAFLTEFVKQNKGLLDRLSR
jgi:uncharacterized protein (DUF1778 family)